jgi:hypothetical protein
MINGEAANRAAHSTSAPTANFMTNPCSTFLLAPAHFIGAPRRTQKLFSLSASRAHCFGLAQMNQSHIALAGQQMMPVKKTIQ